MKKTHKFALFILLSLACVLAVIIFWDSSRIDVLNPKGLIALKQRNLLVISTLIMLIVVVPAIVFTFVFAWKYRSDNEKAKYTPNWENSILAECIWWGIPFIIIVVLSVMVWKTSHELDPFKPLDSPTKPIRIQVVALQWKWLFIYPEEKIATVNFVQFPEKTPLNFEITSDAPMNSFWIPQLGGQIYAMSGMRTKLHLIADAPGIFNGCSANFSGTGFAGMKFIAKASTEADFDAWVSSVKKSPNHLDAKSYKQLLKPSINNKEAFYLLSDDGLFDQIIMKYMTPM